MAFRKVDRPETHQIMTAPQEAGLVFVTVPSLSLFKNELTFWRTQRQQADRAGDVAMRRIAEGASRELRQAAMGRMAIEMMVTSNGPYNAEAAGDWFMDSILSVAHTRMLREMRESLTGHELTFKPDVGLAVDFSPSDLLRSGIHVTDTYLETDLKMQPLEPGQEQYYEGDAIYLRASRPANPTENFSEDFYGFYGQPFNPRGYTSIVPRLKTEYWIPPQS